MAPFNTYIENTFVQALNQFMIKCGVTNLEHKKQITIANTIPTTQHAFFTWFQFTNSKCTIIEPGQPTSNYFETLVDFVRNNAQTLTQNVQIDKLIDDTKNIFELVEGVNISKVLKPTLSQEFDKNSLFKNLQDALNRVFSIGTETRKFTYYVNNAYKSSTNHFIKSSILFLLAEIMKEAITADFIKNLKTTTAVPAQPAGQAKPAVPASTHVGKIRPGKFIPLQEREYISPHYYRERNGKPYNRVRFSPTVRNRQNLRLIV
jgi:hypothetical protein